MAAQPRILVIGDIMLDQYVAGNVTRISPEAPVPVVKVDREWSTLGGAGNVAANVASLGGKATLLGLVGNDAAAATILDCCKNVGITPAMVEGNQPTIVKTRVVSGQQIVRFDREEELVWSDTQLAELTSKLDALIPESDVILLSDYAKGTLSDEVLKLIFDLALANGKRILVDPKRANWSVYKGAFLITPNLAELAMTDTGKGIKNDDNLVVNACQKLRNQFAIENIVATRSSYGMTVVSEQKVLNIPTRALEVFDVSGAGDTVLAAIGVSLAEGKSVIESAFVANAAAGIVVSKRGTAVVHRSELESFLKGGFKEVSRSEIESFKRKNAGRKVVFTNGCFDVLHQGHRKLLHEARQLGDVLVVGLNADDSIKRLKGESRPINMVDQRVEALAALPSVDAIIVFEEDTPFELLTQLQPQIIVKGGDYEPNNVVGADLVDEVIIIPLVEGVSTTKLIN
ncbi:MAG: D-glycero-beta-D-manno-heptose-7-phosphate kinase [Flavobacteriales bacterium]|nr:D-glycero-beta-D-manno-heptose-7-phosphate kinase [Flavobacteriales bacterium]MCB9205224.1 D-glycero-beta-D-manno-heptose-7-phosphate kinase [Flavobacteriales bacterium]